MAALSRMGPFLQVPAILIADWRLKQVVGLCPHKRLNAQINYGAPESP
jgi:hypothetical protein